jgi:hypothetical protein
MLRCLGRRTAEFFAAPASAGPLAALRVGLASVLLLQALALRGNLVELFGNLGLVQAPIIDSLLHDGVVRASWVVAGLAPAGVSEEGALRLLFAVYLAGLAGLLLGWYTRASAIVAWLAHLALKSSGQLSAYGVYEFTQIGLFYCVCFPVGRAWSLDVWSGRVKSGPTADARLGLRVLQLHLCLVYLSSGLEKASGEQWWTGEAVWRALMREDLGQFDFSWLAAYSWVAALACWGTLFVELGYALLVWPARTRRLMALAAVGLHAGIAVAMGLWSFSAVMIVLNVSAFLVPARPHPQPLGQVEPAAVAA